MTTVAIQRTNGGDSESEWFRVELERQEYERDLDAYPDDMIE
jgi:hypothetical protein